MKPLLAAALLVIIAGCGPRQVEVRTAPEATQAPANTVHVVNSLDQAVNVYVVSNGTDIFIRQVPGKTTMDLPVQGISTGTMVTLRATTVDGSRTYSRPNVMLNGRYSWQVP